MAAARGQARTTLRIVTSRRVPKPNYYDDFGDIGQQNPDRGESKRRAASTNNDGIGIGGTPAMTGTNEMKKRWQPPKRSNATTRDVIMADRGPGNKSKKSHHSKARKPSKHGAPSSRPPRVAKKKVVVSPDSSTSTVPETHEEVHRLNPSIDVHARRIHQRRRQVNFGKNTIGYEEYAKQIPKHRRKPRCPDHPQTPDYTMDIPARRWQGMLNAWRRALHKFDPPDLASKEAAAKSNITLAPRVCMTEEDAQQEEIAQAKASGLQVAFGAITVGREGGMFSFNVGGTDDGDLFARDIDRDERKEPTAELDEEVAYNEAVVGGKTLDDGFLDQDDSDSDDDIL